MQVEIVNSIFDPHEKVKAHEKNLRKTGRFGALAMFVGSMRDFNDGDSVSEMFLEYYTGMTEKKLQDILQQVHIDFPILESLVVHRVGKILPGDYIVLVAVWSAHRAAAFDACRLVMEKLKSEAPFWKQEVLSGTTSKRWVENNTPG